MEYDVECRLWFIPKPPLVGKDCQRVKATQWYPGYIRVETKFY